MMVERTPEEIARDIVPHAPGPHPSIPNVEACQECWLRSRIALAIRDERELAASVKRLNEAGILSDRQATQAYRAITRKLSNA